MTSGEDRAKQGEAIAGLDAQYRVLPFDDRAVMAPLIWYMLPPGPQAVKWYNDQVKRKQKT